MSAAITIVGGGPVGATLALALAQRGIACTMLEAKPKGEAYPDGRALALSHGSRLILDRLGVWASIADKVTAINTIHISQKGSLGRSILKAHEHQLPSLGYVVSYGVLSSALDQVLLNTSQAEVLYESSATQIQPTADAAVIEFTQNHQAKNLSVALAVLADGGRSLQSIEGITRKIKEYGHDALVTKVSAELPHDNIAYERFTSMGPVALLPNGPRDFSLVWTGEKSQIADLIALDEKTFLDKLHLHFGDRVGRFITVGSRMSFPLKLATLDPSTAPHLVVVGNAAQTMHPVAGQGFNVGLRDAFELALQIAETAPEEIGSKAMLEKYTKRRAVDKSRGLKFTDFLVNTFSNDLVGVSSLRSAGLGALDLLPSLKNHIVKKMSFGA